MYIIAETTCQRELRIYQQEPNVPGRRKPVCDNLGNYAHKQCIGSQCYCVLKNGTHIPGFSFNNWKAEQQTCYCAREQAEYEATGLVGKMFRCTNDGSYDSIQCTGQYCYCAWHGKQIGESSVHNGRLLVIESYGYIDGNQKYQKEEYLSVIPEGTMPTNNVLDLNCAREQAEYEATGLVGKMFRCTNDGSYDSIQCTGSHCYCADQNGKQIGESSVHITKMDSLNC
ncbi:unnamed protein product [Mytilus edulis]|uniref:Thyroglobulin type-1 domain-containing protein n=1 Tax=Mytilus edulis TaxID=6550 RepID=A0A8S3S7H5_MYTED|nr:unnamed protein product [Mytilus edulis]